MSDFAVEVQDLASSPKATLVIVRGPLDSKTASGFKKRVKRLARKRMNRLVIDMEEVKYVNSTGLECLVNLADAVHTRGGWIVFACIQPKVKVVMEITGLAGYFRVFPTRQDAQREILLPDPATAPQKPLLEASPGPPPVGARSSGARYPAAALVVLGAAAAYIAVRDATGNWAIVLSSAAALMVVALLIFRR